MAEAVEKVISAPHGATMIQPDPIFDNNESLQQPY
jgi:hypothetical protein